jgi:hypothetical protein
MMAVIFLLFACATTTAYEQQKAPGLYNDGFPYWGSWDSEIGVGTNSLHGYVGLPFNEFPKARCIGGTWNFTYPVRIETGALPPGLHMDEQGRITGVPERAGAWYLRVAWDGITCAGMTYKGNYLNLRIVTEGSSAPRSLR